MILSIPAIAAFFGALIKIPLNYFLISNPKINILGAVISTIACYIVASSIDWYFMQRGIKTTPDFIGAIIKPVAASTVMGVVCIIFYNILFSFLKNNSVALLLAILIGVIIYLIILILIKGLKRSDLKLFPCGDKIINFFDKYRILSD